MGIFTHFNEHRREYLRHIFSFIITIILCGFLITVIGGGDLIIGFLMGLLGYDLVFDYIVEKYIVKGE